MAQVLIEQAQGDRLQRPCRRGDLGEDVDAVFVLLDPPLQPADLALDPAQPAEVVIFVLAVTLHAALRPQPAADLGKYCTPLEYGTSLTRPAPGRPADISRPLCARPRAPDPGSAGHGHRAA